MTLRQLILLFSLAFWPVVSMGAPKKKATPAKDPIQEALKKGAPSKGHKVLEPLVGKFTFVSKMWPKANATPIESSGTCENTWVLGKRFLRQDVSGKVGQTPYEAVGYVGYDNVAGLYKSVWMQDTATDMTEGSGSYDPKTRTLSQSGTYACPMTGRKARPFRSEWKIHNTELNTYVYWDRDAHGQEFKALEVTYQRAP